MFIKYIDDQTKTWALIKLSENDAQYFNAQYAVMQTYPTSEWLKDHTEREFISSRKTFGYEMLFQTAAEAIAYISDVIVYLNLQTTIYTFEQMEDKLTHMVDSLTNQLTMLREQADKLREKINV